MPKTKKNSPRYVVRIDRNVPWNNYDVVDSLTGIVQDPGNTEVHAQRIADRMNLEARPVRKLELTTEKGLSGLSYYTQCKLSDFTRLAHMKGVELAIGRGEYKGILIVDDLGNFISFE